MTAWVDDVLFGKEMKLSEESVNHCKNIIGLIARYPNALDYLSS